MQINFNEVFQHSPNAYMVLDSGLRYLAVNHAYELLVGHSREALLGRALFDVFPGSANDDGSAQADVLRASFERVFATGERDVLALIPYAIESSTPGGPVLDMRYWSATHTPLKDAEGRVVAVLQHTTDVTELHLLREELRRARESGGPTTEQVHGGVLSRAAEVQRDNQRLSARDRFLTDLFAQAPGFMAVLRGPDHVFELTNEAYEAIVGRPVTGMAVREALPELAGQGFFELLDGVRDSGEPFVGRSMPVAFADGRTRYVDFIFQPVRGADGHVETIFVQGSDVTDREAALTALRESEARFRTIANMLPQMIWSTRADGYHDYFNQRWYDFTGVPEGAVDGDEWSGLFHPDDQQRAWDTWRHSLATGEPYQIEYRLRDRDGNYRWVLGRALPVRNEAGEIVRWMGTCTDIHEQRLQRETLERSQQALRDADRQKDQFLAMLAHELRNPLAPIGTAAQLLRMAPGRTETVLQAAGIIDRQAAHMRTLVEDLMDVARVTRGQATLQLRQVELAQVVRAAVEQTTPLVEQRRHRLRVDDRVPGLALRADATRLTQILANLLNNAARYTPPGGDITVEIDRDADTLVVRVRDTGIGMEASMLDRVFELFTQVQSTPGRREAGLGIGLALARSLAQLHRGTLEAFSDGPGHGSTFELRLPLASADADGDGAAAKASLDTA